MLSFANLNVVWSNKVYYEKLKSIDVFLICAGNRIYICLANSVHPNLRAFRGPQIQGKPFAICYYLLVTPSHAIILYTDLRRNGRIHYIYNDWQWIDKYIEYVKYLYKANNKDEHLSGIYIISFRKLLLFLNDSLINKASFNVDVLLLFLSNSFNLCRFGWL